MTSRRTSSHCNEDRHTAALDCALSAARAAAGPGGDDGRVADLRGRLFAASLQPAQTDRPDQRSAPHARLAAAPDGRPRRRRRRVVRTASRASRHHRRCGRGADDDAGSDERIAAAGGIDSAGERHPLHLVARQRVGGGRARRTRALALLVEVARRHSHRQPRHGGAQVWTPGSYDPATHLYIFGTGNPTPAYTAMLRAPRDEHTNLYTCSVVALNVDTGKMAWYFQTSPNDTHDWDATQAPVLFDGMFAGKPRKMTMQASRNGYVFVLDRTNGKHLLTAKYSDAANWAETVNAEGQPVRNAAKDNTVAGSLVSPDNGGATNWNPPSYDPRTGFLYVVLREIYAMYYLTNKDPRMLVGLGGSEQDVVGSLGTSIVAIDYQTGKLAWKYRLTGGSGTGLLTTAGGLLFANDGSGSLVAFGLRGRRSPVPLWHAQIGSIENAPETYTVDGRQYVLVTAEGTVWAFSLQ